jgi:PAS domain S-box-containing protein
MVSDGFVEALGLATERKEDEDALMGSEGLYHLLFNASRDAVLILAFDSTMKPVSIIEANDCALELLGYSRNELKALTLADLSGKANVDQTRDTMEKTLSGRDGKFETVATGKGGREIPVEINAHLFEYRGKPAALCVLRDIGEKRRAEAALNESEAKLKTLCDNMIDLISEVDMNGIFSFVSPSYELVVGYSPDDLLGRSLFDFLHPVDTDRMNAIVMSSVGKPGFGKLEIRFKHAQGYYVWLESVGKVRLNPSGYPVGAVISSRDITDRKKIEAALKAEHDFSSAIFDVARAMVIVLDAKGKIVKFNPASEEILGYSTYEAVGKTILDMFAGPFMEVDIEKGKKLFADLMSGTYPITHETNWLKKDGTPLRIFWAATAIADDHQRVQNIVINGMDMTAQRLAEEDLKGRMKLESLLCRVSEAAVVVDSLPVFLNATLKDIRETYNASRSYMLEFNAKSRTMGQAFECCAPGVVLDSDPWQDIPVSSMPGDYEAMMRGEVFAVDDTKDIHFPLFRDKLCKEGIGAVLSVPLTFGDAPYGAIGLDQMGAPRKWRKEEVDALLSIARVVGLVIEREKNIEMLTVKDAAIEMSINSIIFADPAGKLTYVNNAFLRGTGYKDKEEVIGRNIMEFFPRSAEADRIGKILREKGFAVTRASFAKADGSIAEVEITITAITDSKGNLKMIMGSAIDVRKLDGYLREK